MQIERNYQKFLQINSFNNSKLQNVFNWKWNYSKFAQYMKQYSQFEAVCAFQFQFIQND